MKRYITVSLLLIILAISSFLTLKQYSYFNYNSKILEKQRNVSDKITEYNKIINNINIENINIIEHKNDNLQIEIERLKTNFNNKYDIKNININDNIITMNVLGVNSKMDIYNILLIMNQSANPILIEKINYNNRILEIHGKYI